MEYLHGQFGSQFMTDLHLGPENGLDSLAALLDGVGSTAKPLDVIASWATMVAVDKSLDDGFTLTGGDARRVQDADAECGDQLGQRPGVRGARGAGERLGLRPAA